VNAQAWAIRLDPADAEGAGQLRQVAGIEVCEEAEAVWLRGPEADESLQRRLASVPGARRFMVLPDGQLLPFGGRVPRGWLPKRHWMALARWIALVMPPSRFAGRCRTRVPLVLERSDHAEESSLLLASWQTWRDYAVDAPQVRLDRWRFALSADGRAAIHGRPLPPLPGEPWVEQDGIAVPAGWAWSPAVEAAIVRQVFGLAAGDVALWHVDGAWEQIAADDFVRATRAAVRQTAAEMETANK
jgi:hypothetical protein